jgi:hypothetical protein
MDFWGESDRQTTMSLDFTICLHIAEAIDKNLAISRFLSKKMLICKKGLKTKTAWVSRPLAS